ncbi:MAG: hypothetical protein AAGA42_05915 [Actinomycetota bacterium]
MPDRRPVISPVIRGAWETLPPLATAARATTGSSPTDFTRGLSVRHSPQVLRSLDHAAALEPAPQPTAVLRAPSLEPARGGVELPAVPAGPPRRVLPPTITAAHVVDRVDAVEPESTDSLVADAAPLLDDAHEVGPTIERLSPSAAAVSESPTGVVPADGRTTAAAPPATPTTPRRPTAVPPLDRSVSSKSAAVVPNQRPPLVSSRQMVDRLSASAATEVSPAAQHQSPNADGDAAAPDTAPSPLRTPTLRSPAYETPSAESPSVQRAAVPPIVQPMAPEEASAADSEMVADAVDVRGKATGTGAVSAVDRAPAVVPHEASSSRASESPSASVPLPPIAVAHDGAAAPIDRNPAPRRAPLVGEPARRLTPTRVESGASLPARTEARADRAIDRAPDTIADAPIAADDDFEGGRATLESATGDAVVSRQDAVAANPATAPVSRQERAAPWIQAEALRKTSPAHASDVVVGRQVTPRGGRLQRSSDDLVGPIDPLSPEPHDAAGAAPVEGDAAGTVDRTLATPIRVRRSSAAPTPESGQTSHRTAVPAEGATMRTRAGSLPAVVRPTRSGVQRQQGLTPQSTELVGASEPTVPGPRRGLASLEHYLSSRSTPALDAPDGTPVDRSVSSPGQALGAIAEKAADPPMPEPPTQDAFNPADESIATDLNADPGGPTGADSAAQEEMASIAAAMESAAVSTTGADTPSGDLLDRVARQMARDQRRRFFAERERKGSMVHVW